MVFGCLPAALPRAFALSPSAARGTALYAVAVPSRAGGSARRVATRSYELPTRSHLSIRDPYLHVIM